MKTLIKWGVFLLCLWGIVSFLVPLLTSISAPRYASVTPSSVAIPRQVICIGDSNSDPYRFNPTLEGWTFHCGSSEINRVSLTLNEVMSPTCQPHPALHALLNQEEAAVILVALGENDVPRGNPKEFAASYHCLVGALTERGFLPILHTIPPMPSSYDQAVWSAQNETIRSIARTSDPQLPYMDLAIGLEGAMDPADPLHYSVEGENSGKAKREKGTYKILTTYGQGR